MKLKTQLYLVCLVTLSLSCQFFYAQSPGQQIADSLQAILNRSLPTNVTKPGAIMSVYVPGQWSWSGSTGYAINGITPGKPATTAIPTDKFRVGSITKTFMATAILMLQEQNLLNIEDTIGMYLRPSLLYDTIKSSSPVKIRHLLNHTSGINNSSANITCQQNALANLTAPHTLEEGVYCGASMGQLFAPGTSWAYSNTNYCLLAMIIQKVTGQSSATYITQHIINHLGLADTEIPSVNEISSPHMGCYWNIGGLKDMTIVNPTLYGGWADIVSTTNDLNKFYYSLQNLQLINAQSLVKMKTMFPGTNDYGLGLDFYTIGSATQYYGHTGEVGNSSSMFYAALSSSVYPNGYYVSYNFNYQGINMWSKIDVPVFYLMTSSLVNSVSENANTLKVINLFPNPAKDVLTLQYTNATAATGEFTIMDINGAQVDKIFISNTPGVTDDKIITIEKIKPGIYFYELKFGERKCYGKFIKSD